jgi:hypothetical protein
MASHPRPVFSLIELAGMAIIASIMLISYVMFLV